MAKKILYPGLASEMAKRGITQDELAKVIGLTQSQISLRLNDITKWSIDEIEKICDYLGKSYNELFKKGE